MSDVLLIDQIEKEVNRRRTFAIISHPDAGKTTLTEKLLLYAGAVESAGAVRSKKNQQHAKSDWMEIEQQRGISITSTVLQFEHEGYRFNLLDTPGHQDFSEDTYRTLTAVDSAVMILDGAKGIEAQTLKLFEVCRMKGIPILTFINKMDLPSRTPLELMDEIEQTLNIMPIAMNWPIGDGDEFQGVYDIHEKTIARFSRTQGGQHRAPVYIASLDDSEQASELLGEKAYNQIKEDVELLAIAGDDFDKEAFLNGQMTPVYFGSAINNFGIETFLEALIHLAPSPRARMSDQGAIEPTDAQFTGFVFKVQANMDPRHRDRMAFVRVCSGRFEKDMQAYSPRLDKSIRMNRIHRLFAQDREIVEEAYPGDVVGLTNSGLTLGDTLTGGTTLAFDPIPRFQPEHFGTLRLTDVGKYKQFRKGLSQLEEEGVIQVLYPVDEARRDPILAAVGLLQFEVVQARLESEYGAPTTINFLPHSVARWVSGPEELIRSISWGTGNLLTKDVNEDHVALFTSEFQANYLANNNPQLTFKTHN